MSIDISQTPLPAAPPIPPSIAATELSLPANTPARPSVTVTLSRTQTHARTLAAVVARASLNDPLNTLFAHEADPTADLETSIRTFAQQRITRKLAAAQDAFIIEAANFAAATAWEPARITQQPVTDTSMAQIQVRQPGRWKFMTDLAALQERVLWPVVRRFDQLQGGGEGVYWHLCLTARDPGREYVAGAVRAVIAGPLRDLFEGEGVVVDGVRVGETALLSNGRRRRTPVWLESSSVHSRDIYAHFGFRTVGSWELGGVNGEKVVIWGMMYTGDFELDWT